jgi:hypothetical protein
MRFGLLVGPITSRLLDQDTQMQVQGMRAGAGKSSSSGTVTTVQEAGAEAAYEVSAPLCPSGHPHTNMQVYHIAAPLADSVVLCNSMLPTHSPR